jgi:hypothetical protein
MTASLVRYEAARVALAEAHRVDEVKDIRDKAEAMAAYARQAKDQELILWATEIKVRAERRAGELLTTMEKNKGGDARKYTRSHDETGVVDEKGPPTLADLGIHRNESHRWQQLASMSDEHFETAVATAKDTAGQVTTAFMLREAEKLRPTKRIKKIDQQRLKDLESAKERGVSMLASYARLTLTALRTQQEFSEAEQSALRELFDGLQQVSFLQGEHA